jgi:hypothetical protein
LFILSKCGKGKKNDRMTGEESGLRANKAAISEDREKRRQNGEGGVPSRGRKVEF